MDKKSNKTIFWGLVVIAAMAVLSLGAEGIADATGQTLLMTVLKKGTVYALLVVSMNLLNGFTGLFSLGQAGFMLIGAYTYAILTIPVAKRAGVYQYYDGGIVQFSIPEAFSGLLGDLVGGVIGMVVTLLICGLLAALYRASRTGAGDKVTVSLFHSAIWDVGIMLQAAQYGDKSTQYPITRKSVANPFNLPQKTRDGRWVQFSAPAYDRMYDRFVTAMDRADLIGDPRFYPQANLQNNLEEFYSILVEAAAQKTLDEWCAAFKAADIPYAVAQTWDELLKDEQAWAADCFYEMEYPTGARRTLVRPPVMFADTPLPEYKRGPYCGEHTEEILAGLGYTGERIKAMLETGAAAHPEPVKG